MLNNINNFGMNNFGMNNMGMNNMGMNNFGMNNFRMNNIGMNYNGLNNIGMNNMGINQMNMNNQANLKDENALRIKNLIQPYENKIKELEEVIRQKDFEIAVLKDKLNNNNINMQNQNLMNMNAMNMMMPNSNKDSGKMGKEIVVSYMNFENNILPEKNVCFEEEMAYKLFDRMIGNYHWKLIKFYCGEKKINPFITIKENGIVNGSIIKGSFALNIVFKNMNGSIINIATDGNYPIKKPIKYYLQRIGKEGCFREFSYFYNGVRLDIEDKRPIKVIFRNAAPNVNIIVQ